MGVKAPNARAKSLKLSEENTGMCLSLWIIQLFLRYNTKSTSNQRGKNQINRTSAKRHHEKTPSRIWKDNPKTGRK